MVLGHVVKQGGANGATWTGIHVLRCALMVSALIIPVSAASGQSAQGSAPSAQGSAPSAQASDPSAQASSGQENALPEQQPPPTSDDRLFWTLPNFLTVQNAGTMRPLTVGEKYDVVFRTTFDYVEFAWYGLLAGISQAENSSPADGRGFSGFSKRFGTAFADGSIDNFMVGAILPSILKEDPRYFQLGQGSGWRRVKYSVSRLIVTRADGGHDELNLSEIFGTAATAGLATVYRPASDRNLRTAASVWATQLAYDGLALTLKEFWPDIKRKITHR